MALTNEEQVLEMARLAGIPLAAEEVPEVTNRLNALLDALEALLEMDLEGVEPFIVPEEEAPGG
jgi:Asp-tRNA(Asn)/Glu-tRNA(Gln) amidotransferase C subunit